MIVSYPRPTRPSVPGPLLYRLTFLAIAAVGVVFSARQIQAASAPTALDRYVAAPDTNFSFKVINSNRVQKTTSYVLELTSQAWLTTNEVDQPLWKHWLTIVRPDQLSSATGMLLIAGGSINRPAPKGPDIRLLEIALSTKTLVAELSGVPNQPLTFADETKSRSEDALIAYTWDKFLRTHDEKWPARLPMTKSAVRAMDAVAAFSATKEGGGAKIEHFVVTGASKRGWTTWTTAAVDKRVVAIIPIVIDMLNLEQSFRHHYESYGFWAPAVKDYTRLNLMDWMGTPEHAALMKIEEPFQYRDRLTMPKFIINGADDQFFLPDSSRYYFDQLPGVKYLRYVPNADHSMRGSDAAETALACYNAIISGEKLPDFSWKFEADGSISAQPKSKPASVKLWHASNPDARDFRLETVGQAWTSEDLQADKQGNYIGRVEKPVKGWTAFLVELTFPSTISTPFKFTSGIRVIPDTVPYKLEVKAPKRTGDSGSR
jgi:PhoPQ-activated pathogenicity-related protein